ncbi:hypothetical protein PDESU_02946 [Pontiella desulfatans]|uniref:Thiol-disulfide oxidoreductase DCC n=1 Tax=Pontiella desulfatans TaxID=2750659 RepID=A0A6C2U3E1_PONDE|nr:DUF393 domain-containing protein [Pontiella desulfatans]VGO14385.1 hypothetical protein PDESU_02946 [Pontiella desulfatans]
MENPLKTQLLYDGNCPICCRKVAFIERRDAKRSLEFIDIRAPDFKAEDTGIEFQTLETRIHAVLPDGSMASGMEAVRAAYRAIGLGWLVSPTGWPILRIVFDALYRLVAQNRMLISRFIR